MRPIFAAFLGLATLATGSPEDLSDRLEALRGKTEVPGIAAIAIRKGEPIAAAAAGMRKTGSPERVTLDDKFHLGSCTKSMTASLAAMLVADGSITWGTRCRDRFPGMEIHPDFRDATLRQLVSNTGGASHVVPLELWSRFIPAMPEAEQRELLVRETLKAPPAYLPGRGSMYSNTGFSIAGSMLERASGRSYETLMREHLFRPLGMDSAGFGAPASPGKVDQPYGHVRRDGMLVAIDPGPEGDNPPAISPAGRVHASIRDFAKYASFHLGDLKHGPLDSRQLEDLHRQVAPAPDYACGWVVTERPWAGGVALTHTGSNTMFFCVMWLAPAKDFAVVVTCNSGEGAKLCDDTASMMIRHCLR